MGINEKEFYKRTIWDKILDYKGSILAIILLLTSLAFLYAMVAKKTYTTDATVEVSPKLNKLSASMQLESSQNVFARHLQTQIDFLQSRSLIQKVVTKLQENIHYFRRDGFRYARVTRDLPYRINYIDIKDPSFFQKRFVISALDENRYRLSMVIDKNPFAPKRTKPLEYQFGKMLHTDYFDIKISRNERVEASDLYFQVYDLKAYVEYVLGHLSVMQKSPHSSIIKIVYSDTNPYSAQQFVNALINTFLTINRKQEISEVENLLQLINEKLKHAKAKLDESEKRLKAYIAGNKVAGLDQQTSQIIQMIFKYEKELETLKIRLHKLKTVDAIYRSGYDYRKIIALVQEINNPNLTKFIEGIAANEDAYQKLRMRYKPSHPEVVKVRHIIEDKLRDLARNIKDLEDDTRMQMQEVKKILNKYKAELTTLPQKEFGYTRLKRKHDLLEKNYLFLLDKQTQVIISKQTEGSYEYRVIDEPYLPAFASAPNKKVLLLLGLVGGTILGLLYALFRVYFAKYIEAPSDVTELTDLPYLGTIPYIKDKRIYNDLYIIKDPESIASQMLWSLRASIEEYVDGSKKGGKVIAVTSIVKGEGKTSLAANLALCLGMGDKKTVAVSMDLRLPELHAKFDVPVSPGITSVLFGDRTLDEVTFVTDALHNFALIPAGEPIDNPLKLINSNKLDTILAQLRQKYDYIILDLPPVGVAAEAIVLMKKSDLVVSVLKANYSEKSFVTYMESIVHEHSIHHVGFVLSGVHKRFIKILTRKENLKYLKRHKKIVKKSTQKA